MKLTRTTITLAAVFAVIALTGLAMRVIGPQLGPESHIGQDMRIFGPLVAMLGGFGLFMTLFVGVLKSPKKPAAGWYPDAHDPALLRYFDGRQWTEHTASRQ
ncbi:DUF2510 domain-containing protein [Mycobacterium sp. NPDC003323]